MPAKSVFKSAAQRAAQPLVYVLAGVVLAALLGLGSGPAVGDAAPAMASNSLGLAAPEAETWVSCTPLNVGALNNRIHVRCAESYGGVYYFAMPNDNPAHVARTLSLLSTAQVAGRTLSILYDPADLSGAGWGCAESNCRALRAVEIAS